MGIASVLTIVAVLLTRETRGEGLTHDRALPVTEPVGQPVRGQASA